MQVSSWKNENEGESINMGPKLLINSGTFQFSINVFSFSFHKQIFTG